MILTILCLFTISVQEGLSQDKLTRFELEENRGYKNSSGQVVIKPQFAIAGEFSREGIAAVADGTARWRTHCCPVQPRPDRTWRSSATPPPMPPPAGQDK